MIVVDTNIIGYLYLESQWSVQAEQALFKDAQWATPLIWRSEFRNVLARYIRNKLLSLGDALRIMEKALDQMRDREYDVSSLQVLSLAASSACSAYDCEFVALAQALEVQLVTLDREILNQFPSISISLSDFVID